MFAILRSTALRLCDSLCARGSNDGLSKLQDSIALVLFHLLSQVLARHHEIEMTHYDSQFVLRCTEVYWGSSVDSPPSKGVMPGIFRSGHSTWPVLFEFTKVRNILFWRWKEGFHQKVTTLATPKRVMLSYAGPREGTGRYIKWLA